MYRLWLLYCQAEVLLLRQGLESRQEPGVLLLQDEGMCCRAGELGLEVQHLQGVMRAGQGGGGVVWAEWWRGLGCGQGRMVMWAGQGCSVGRVVGRVMVWAGQGGGGEVSRVWGSFIVCDD